MKLLYAEMASAVDAWKNCCAVLNGEKTGDVEAAQKWVEKWDGLLHMMERQLLPTGSGFNRGTKLDRDRSHGEKLVLTTAWQHMDEGGGYAGWTEHTITVTPGFNGIHINVGGRDRNNIKEYIHETFSYALTADIEYEYLLEMLPQEKRVYFEFMRDQEPPYWRTLGPIGDMRFGPVGETRWGTMEEAKAHAVAAMLEKK